MKKFSIEDLNVLDFLEACQEYRHAPLTDDFKAVVAIEKLKLVIENIVNSWLERHVTKSDTRLMAMAAELLDAAKWAHAMAVNEILKLNEKLDINLDIGERPDPEYIQIFIDYWESLRVKFQKTIAKAEGK